MSPTYAVKLDLITQKTSIAVLKIDSLALEIYNITSADFSL